MNELSALNFCVELPPRHFQTQTYIQMIDRFSSFIESFYDSTIHIYKNPEKKSPNKEI